MNKKIVNMLLFTVLGLVSLYGCQNNGTLISYSSEMPQEENLKKINSFYFMDDLDEEIINGKISFKGEKVDVTLINKETGESIFSETFIKNQSFTIKLDNVNSYDVYEFYVSASNITKISVTVNSKHQIVSE